MVRRVNPTWRVTSASDSHLDRARRLESRLTAGISQLRAVRDAVEFYSMVKDESRPATTSWRQTAKAAFVENVVGWAVRGFVILLLVALVALGILNWDAIRQALSTIGI